MLNQNEGRPGTWETEIQLMRENGDPPRMTGQKTPRSKAADPHRRRPEGSERHFLGKLD